MPDSPLERIAELLTSIGGGGSFAASRTAAADDLHIEVRGVGPLHLPVSPEQARRLCRIGRPARYGRGTETLLDARVRDTREIPKSRVKIDGRRWNRTLRPVLDRLREDLGFLDGCRLEPELHSLLIYAPGQFFLPHRDSEKSDEMVGTLVVTLPSRFEGGAFVVEHGGEKLTYDGASDSLTFVAFYADCRHEVRPVKEGYRIVLTYDLMLECEGAAAVESPGADPSTIQDLARQLDRYFRTLPPSPRRPRGAPSADEPPSRLAYLLDHQYTQRGFAWERLKGGDAARVEALRAAAEEIGCEVVLALAKIRETWGCYADDWDEPWYRGSRRWERGEDGDWYEDDPSADDPDSYQLGDLQDSSITLRRWLESGGKKRSVRTHLSDHEVCYTTPTASLEPYESEYEGYMGNWGNTMDRWYRRAAVVLWPRERAFAVRAEASPVWAVKELRKRIREGSVDEARVLAESLVPSWNYLTAGEKRRGFFEELVTVAAGLRSPELALSLLRPFAVQALTPRGAATFAALVGRYGEPWTAALLSDWSSPSDRWMHPSDGDSLEWLASLPRLCDALCDADEEAGTAAAELVLEDRWSWLEERIEGAREIAKPATRDRSLERLTGSVLGFLEAAWLVAADDLRRESVAFLCADRNEPALPLLVSMLRKAAERMTPEVQVALGLDAVRQRCIHVLETRLSRAGRAEEDWSIPAPGGCDCKLCERLAAFLTSADERRLVWPLAKNDRKHVHQRIDSRDLPVSHETRRSGRPYSLVLTKSDALFEREAAERESWRAQLAEIRAPRGP